MSKYKNIPFSRRNMHRWPILNDAKMFTKNISLTIKEAAYSFMWTMDKIHLASSV